MARAPKPSAKKSKAKAEKKPAKALATGSRARDGGPPKKRGRPRKPDAEKSHTRIRGRISPPPEITCSAEDAQRWRDAHGIGTTEDDIAITWIEVDKIGGQRELNGSRLNWMRLRADLRKLLHLERMANESQGASVHIVRETPPVRPEDYTDPPELPT